MATIADPRASAARRLESHQVTYRLERERQQLLDGERLDLDRPAPPPPRTPNVAQPRERALVPNALRSGIAASS